MIKAALFDLDGVVVDTESQYTTFWGGQFRHYLPECPNLEHEIKGMTLVQIFAHYFPGKAGEQQAIKQALDDFESKMHYDYIKGFTQFVTLLRSNHVKTAVVTSSNRLKMENVYRRHADFKSYFDAVFTSEDFTKSKPHPECYLTAARRLGVPPAECAGFEDSVNGLKAVMAAGMTVVGLTTTNSEAVVAQWADVLAHDFTDMRLSMFE